MGGDLGSSKKQESDSSVKDSRVTGGGNAYGGSGNTTTVIEGGDMVAQKALDTFKDVFDRAESTQLQTRAYDADLLKTFATASANLSQSTSDRLATLAETKITDGANLNQKTTMVALVIGGAVVVFTLLKRR